VLDKPEGRGMLLPETRPSSAFESSATLEAEQSAMAQARLSLSLRFSRCPRQSPAIIIDHQQRD
jgi:hypothetical protein